MLYRCIYCNRLSAGSALVRHLQNVVAPYRRMIEFSSILLLLLHQILLVVYYCYYVVTRPQGLGALTVSYYTIYYLYLRYRLESL